MDSLRQLKIDLYGDGITPSSFKYLKIFGPDIKAIGLKQNKIDSIIKKYADDKELILDEIPLAESLELTAIYFAISLKRIDSYEKQLAFLDKKLKYAKSWAITDTLNKSLKKANRRLFDCYFKRWSKSKDLYKKRFAFVYAMKFYKDDNIAPYLKAIDNDDRYYVMMAEAWYLATAAISHEDEVYELLASPTINLKLKRKAISKICDSFRIDKISKDRFKQLRQK